MKELSSVLFIFFILYTLGGCTTSPGSVSDELYRSNNKNEHTNVNKDESTDPYIDDDTQYEDKDGLYITSFPHQAQVFIDSRYRGTTPLFIPSLDIGNYRIKIQLPGYYPYETRIYYPGGYLKQSIRLRVISGSLQLDITPVDARFYLDDLPMGNHLITGIRVGPHTLLVRKFGYRDHEETIIIKENETIFKSIDLQPAHFSITNFNLSRKVFNPRNPGGLGKTDITFFVSTYGKATIIVSTSTGEKIYSQDIPEFQTWYQRYSWNGRFTDNSVCPDGEYSIRLDAKSKDDGELFSLSHTVRIDSSLTISFRNSWNGISGLTYVCSAEVLPFRSFQTSTLVNVQVPVENDQTRMNAPVILIGRSGIGNNLEVNLLGSLIFSDTDYLPFTVSAGIKYQMLNLRSVINLGSAVYAKATYHYGTGADTFSNYSGLSLGIPFQGNVGPLFLLICPEIIMSPYPVTYSDDYNSETAFNIRGYGRFGIMLDYGVIITGISGAIRTTSFAGPEEFTIHYPLLGAYELHVMVPESNTYISLTVATEFTSADSFNILGGFGLGLIY
ncbi:MAG: PEGA domain-containing protein [Spirochaetales bacterium]|nr:PEGA domain-containing protein [Spirochaetales bacterium]